jgi:hypothetical protein
MGSNAYSAGRAFSDFLTNQAYPAARDAVLNTAMPVRPALQAVGPTLHDFISGAVGGTPPLSNTMTVALPRARAAAPKAAAPPAGLGQLSPAAAAVLAHASIANAATPAKPAAAAADPMAAFGNLSFRQLVALSQASQNLQPKGSTRPPSATDAAGAALAQIYQQQFKTSIDAAGKDAAKQQAAIDAFEKKMLPIALKGNTADEYLYGSQ